MFKEIMAAITVIALAGFISFSWIRRPEPAGPTRAHRHQCELARMDAQMLIGLSLSKSELDRDSARHGVYDLVALEQRQCALFTVPAIFHCETDGCRSASLAIMNAVMP